VILGDVPPGEWQSFPVVPRSPARYEAVAGEVGLQRRVLGRLVKLGHHSGLPSQDEQRMLSFRQPR